MLSPSHSLQPAVARVRTNSTTKLAVPESATRRRHRRSLLKLVAVLVTMLGLGLPGTIWSVGLAQDLPRVQMAAASTDSVEASVDLSDPTKFPFSSTGKWTGYLDFLGKPGTKRSLGQPDLFLPLLQDKNDMTFFNLRGQLQFDNTDVHEYNIGLGHRHMFQEWILGGYGYYDQRHTQLGNSYNQFTGGFEAMSVDWGMRINGYLPENQTETSTSAATTAQVIRPGDQIKVQVDGLVQERALPGVDGEVGYLLPIPWRAYTAVFDETRVYAGGYHFFGENQFQSVTGPRGRVEWRAYDLPVLGPGSRFMMGVEAQWDEPRGSQAFGLASLRIPFDVFADKSKRKALTGLDRRMLQPVIRDVDVVTSERDITEVVAALNPAGKAYTKAIDVTLDDLGKAVADHEDEVVAIFVDGKGITSLDLDDPDSGFVLPGNNQTLSIMGKELVVGYETEQYGSGTVGYTPAGTPFALTRRGVDKGLPVINMNPGSHLNGLEIDGTNSSGGIFFKQLGDHYITNIIIRDVALNVDRLTDTDITQALAFGFGIYTGGGASVYLSNARIYDNPNGRGFYLTAGNAYIDNSYFHNNMHGVVADGASSYITITDSVINATISTGVNSQGGTFIIRRSTISNGVEGLFASAVRMDGSGGRIEVYDSVLSGNRIGANVAGSNNLLMITDTPITDSTRWGVTIGNATNNIILTNVEISGTLYDQEFEDIYGNVAGNGAAIFGQTSPITVVNSRIFGNVVGLHTRAGGTINTWNTTVFDNTLVNYQEHSNSGGITIEGEACTSTPLFDLQDCKD